MEQKKPRPPIPVKLLDRFDRLPPHQRRLVMSLYERGVPFELAIRQRTGK